MEERKFNLFLAFFAGIGMGASILILITILNLQPILLSFEFKNEGPIGFMEDIYYNYHVSKYQHDMRNFTVNLTRGCNNNEMCYLKKIYFYLKENVDYISVEEGAIYPPMYTIETKSGDCKGVLVALCSMLRSVGQDCYWHIDFEKGHIYALSNVKDIGLFKMDVFGDGLVLIDGVDKK